jgi:hypothetical protein
MAEQVRGLNEMLARFQVGMAEISTPTSVPASAPAHAGKPAKSTAAASPRVERRGPNRPWGGRPKGKAAPPQATPGRPGAESARASAPPPSAASRGNGTVGTSDAGDSEWQEF